MKKKILILSLLFFVVCIIVFAVVLLSSQNDSFFIENRINLYDNDKTNENLHELCNTLSYTEDFENKIIYFNDYISLCAKGNVEQIKIENNEYMTKNYTDSYKAEYCLALLHLNKYDEFENYYKENFVLDTEISCFHNILMFELNTFNWTTEQLKVLSKTLNNELKNISNANIKYQNYCINFVISSKTSDQSD